MNQLSVDVQAKVRDVPNFPKPGIVFKDITPVLADAALCRSIYQWMAEGFQDIDVVVGVESRGFIFGVPVAAAINASFAPARKAGKLPYHTISREYALEYGTATIEMHKDAIVKGQRVLICDDLLATGGTACAVEALVTELGGMVAGHVFLIELAFLNGGAKLQAPVKSLIQYG